MLSLLIPHVFPLTHALPCLKLPHIKEEFNKTDDR